MPRPRPAPGSPPPAGTARTAALGLLGRRDYTRAELAERLARRGFPADAVESALDSLAEAGHLDDRRVADAAVRTSVRVRGRGRRRIEQELLARGLDRSVVHDALAAVPASEEADALDRLLARQRVPARLTPAERHRLFRRLLRRGFPAETIARALERRGNDGTS